MAKTSQVERVRPLVRAGVASAGPKHWKDWPPSNLCQENCQWYIDSSCAVTLIASQLPFMATKLQDIANALPALPAG